ncbi:MAG: arylsulfatase [Sedimentisphaerales bacterium]|nr:arylsulfatase [Sedimentisphaerales bacterium]
MKLAKCDRREFLKSVGWGAAAVSLPMCTSVLHSAEMDAGEKPNIVFILADDMGYGDLGCQNPESKIPTPCLDGLAAQGMRFTDAHSSAALCTPTRYGIVTGRYNWRTRLKIGVIGGYSRNLIDPKRTTVASFLKQRGYNTACIGKWHLGFLWPSPTAETYGGDYKNGTDNWHDVPVPPDEHLIDYSKPLRNGPTDLGFDYYFGISSSLDIPPYFYIENDHTVGIPNTVRAFHPNKPGPSRTDFTAENVMPTLTQKAVQYINKADKTKPFFLYFPLTAPHYPIVPVKKFHAMSEAGKYGDFVCQVDFTVGEVLKALKENGMEDNTLVIFTSDNGPEFERITHEYPTQFGHYSNRPLRGRKRATWDGGHRVPFIASWPGKIKPGTTSDEIICLTDLFATCAAVVGTKKLPADVAEDSYNILPAMLGEKLDKPIREATIHHSGAGKFSIRQGKWKCILCQGGGDKYVPVPYDPKKPKGQLYNLEEDIGEKNNLWEKHPEIVKRLTAILEKYKAQGYSRPM